VYGEKHHAQQTEKQQEQHGVGGHNSIVVDFGGKIKQKNLSL
jgi:hypothetical protein